ncbi:protein-associating with the carboxyl-terminal domain of ezrin [Drosophila rhopaloa]|uniref:Protein-associating with the carboxyl-terminal domain of ezrin n=1 Tax=Drosophila rhopaloa TaxID=1041015 RepID=A0A6P4ECF5_DRORH|nr:protein-associating with the carboxyl-terminal domain of ezrin [Drosophila rhopaloa]
MGNEGSKLKGLIIEKNAVEVNDFWTLYNAQLPTTSNDEGCCQRLSVFQGEIFVKGLLWSNGMTPIERAIKNLMVYRHPYILKYVATWDQSGQKHLATERVRPLNEVLAQQTNIEICLGLRTILCSLIFLIETALARHLNINTHSIYVTDSGSWRLAGFEYVWRAIEVDKQLLDVARSFINPNIPGENCEQFSFAFLCEQVLDRSKSERGDGDDTPHAKEFREYCSTHLKHQNTNLRPRLSAILLHPYFNHEFVLIHSFLFELPLKSVQERQQFFGSLIERLRCFDEEVVASQLACDLLSRMVLLDPAAQKFVTPHVLRTKVTDKATASLFSPQTYVQYLMPHILKMFRLRDAQIRLILLDYFIDYIHLLSDEQLQSEILPHLQLGMSDTNDVLVAQTLRCMADLVPILGANKALGGDDRRRWFSDGRPHAAVSAVSSNFIPEPRSITPLINTRSFEVEDDFMVSGSPLPAESIEPPLSIRLSPDGGEDEKGGLNLNEKLRGVSHNSDPETNSNGSPTGLKKTLDILDEEAVWSDWDTTDELHRLHINGTELDDQVEHDLESNDSAPGGANLTSLSDSFNTDNLNLSLEVKKPLSKTDHKFIDDLSALDIQVQSVSKSSELSEFDFFKDMQPVIEAKTSRSEDAELINSRFAAAALTAHSNVLDAAADQGWGHEEQDEDDIVWGTKA